MLKLTIDERHLVPVRMVPFVTGWIFSPDELARILADREGFHRVHIPTLHLQPDGTHQQMLAKEWDVVIADLEILTQSLKSKEMVDDENYPLWRGKSVKLLPAGTFVWLHDLEAAWNTAFSEGRITLSHERLDDRKLNHQPFIPESLWRLIYEGFEPVITTSPPSEEHPSGITVMFDKLHSHLNLDPYYGLLSTATEAIISGIYRDNAGTILYPQFRRRFSLLPCKGDKQRELIYLWCGLMGLPTYRGGSPLDWQWEDFLENWTQDFQLRLDELKDFLRQHSWPLPSAHFPNEVDNTDRKVALDEEEFDRAFHDFTVLLPQLKEELAEIKRIQPESMEARQQKKIEIEKIERRVAAINDGNYKDYQETPGERLLRLEFWFQEEGRLGGERGALKRTAEREGIARQTLSKILNRLG